MKGANTCPFCKGEPEYREVQHNPNPHLYFSTLTIQCGECKASIQPEVMPVFKDCSNYSVQDFRDDPSLRPKVNIVLKQRIADLESNLLVTWNRRKP